MNFAPYQSSPPESLRALSPPPARKSTSQTRNLRLSSDRPRPTLPPQPFSLHLDEYSQESWNDDLSTIPRGRPPPDPAKLRYASYQEGEPTSKVGHGDGRHGGLAHYDSLEQGLSQSMGGEIENDDIAEVFETSLGLRIDNEACLAYVLFPPFIGLVLLIYERKSDYVRFHAWQSIMLVIVFHLFYFILSWSTMLSLLLVLLYFVCIGFLTYRAYWDAQTLDRIELPIIGALSSSLVDREQ